MAAEPARAARLSLRAVFSAQEGRAAARRERASLFVEPAVSEDFRARAGRGNANGPHGVEEKERRA